MSGDTLSSDAAACSVDVLASTPLSDSRLETLRLTLLTACNEVDGSAADRGAVACKAEGRVIEDVTGDMISDVNGTVRNVIVVGAISVGVSVIAGRNDVSVRNIGAHVTTLVSKRASMAGQAAQWTTARHAAPSPVVAPAAAVRRASRFIVRVSPVRAPKDRESAPSVHVTSVTERKAAPFGSFHCWLLLPFGRRCLALPFGRRILVLPSGKRGVSAAGDRTRGGMLVHQKPKGSTPCHGQDQYRARQLASFVRSGELSSPFCGIVSR